MGSEITTLESKIPSEWNNISDEFQTHLKTLSKLQRKYRRAMDDSYEGVANVVAVISAGDQLEVFKPELLAVISAVTSIKSTEAAVLIKETSTGLNKIPGSDAVKSLMSKSRRAYKKNETDKGLALLEKAAFQLDSELLWRKAALPDVVPTLMAFQDESKHHIGLRSQDRLPKFLVPRISNCKAAHTDISLQF